MASAFASQLQAIAARSTHELDLKARRTAHAESLLFDRPVAAKQDFDSIYNICREGYRELCQLDARFLAFDRNLFSEQSITQDRDQMSRLENEALDAVLRRSLTLLAGRILLAPAIKALEWLVRRFRVHVYNVDDLLLALLPYHEAPIWATAVSIVPNDKIGPQWKFIRPYVKTTWNIPRQAVAHAAANNDAFFARLNAYILDACQQGLGHSTLMRFWSSLVVEAVSHRLAQTRSGRKEVERQRIQDLLHKILPLLSEGFDLPGAADLTTTCYTIALVLAAKAELADNILDSLLLAVAQTLLKVDHDAAAAVVTMAVLTSHKAAATVPRKVLDILAALEALGSVLVSAAQQYECASFIQTLVVAALSHMKRRNARKFALFIESLVHVSQDPNATVKPELLIQPAVEKLLALNMDEEADDEAEIRNQLVAMLQRMSETEVFAKAISTFPPSRAHDMAVLEGLLGMTISLPQPDSKHEKDADMIEVDQTTNNSGHPDHAVPLRWDSGSSCLAVATSEAFTHLAAEFEECCNHHPLNQQFRDLQIWTLAPNKDLLWQTFLLRFACAKAPSRSRARALRLLAEDLQVQPALTIQIIVPFGLVLLSAKAKIVRRAAADLLKQCQSDLSGNKDDHNGNTVQDIYGDAAAQESFPLTGAQVKAIITDSFMPVIEECVLDSSYVAQIVNKALQPHGKHDGKTSHSQALFSLLTQHALHCPLLHVKTSILNLLEGVNRVGNKSKLKVLAPVLSQWSAYSASEAVHIAAEGDHDLAEINRAIVQLIDLHDPYALSAIAQLTARKDLVDSLFAHVQEAARSYSPQQMVLLTEALAGLAFSEDQVLAAPAQGLLRSIDLDAEVLASLLQMSQEGSSEVRAPPAKRRKRSSSGSSMSRTDAVKVIGNATAKIGLTLELVEANAPETKPELINAMFGMLATLRQLQQSNVESPYLLNLCLSSISAMTAAARTGLADRDLSGVKPELVADCLRNSSNPQVQNASLLVMAGLSSLVPERIVHNVMPIFTFVGRNMLSKDDEYSVHVINEAIDKIVPALLVNLRKGKNFQSYQTSLASLLASFTAAYDHIPQHRRMAFYQKLLDCIDAREAGYMLVALLSDQHKHEEGFVKPLQELVSILSPSTQLMIYRQLLYIAVDVLTPSPKQAAVVFNTGRSTTSGEKVQYARSTMHAAVAIVTRLGLATAITRLTKSDALQAEDLLLDLQACFESTLATIRDMRHTQPSILDLAKTALEGFLGLPSITDLLAIVTPRLDEMDEAEIRPQAMKIIALQIKRNPRRDSRAQNAALSLLSKLSTYMQSSTNSAVFRSSLACADNIIEAFGRKHPDRVVEVGQVIAGRLNVNDMKQLHAAQLLALTGAIETIKEAAVPLIPLVIARVSDLLAAAVETGVLSAPLWSAVCALLAAVFAHTAFIVSQEEFTTTLKLLLSTKARVAADQSDYEGLARSITTKVDLDLFVAACKAVIAHQLQNPESAIKIDILALLSQALESASKNTVIKQAEPISELILMVLDLEKRPAETEDRAESQAMDELNTACISYIYKLNDTTFRPIFESWVSWSTSNGSSTPHRQQALFTLLAHFFATLKALVTSYASYLLKPISDILTSSASTPKHTPTSVALLETSLILLRTITSHDQDSFFAAPSHFDAVAQPLVSCLTLASQKSFRHIITSQVIPTVASLAASTMDSPQTHSTLTSHIVKLKSHSSARVRLASIETLLAMAEDEDLGYEFLSNAVGTGPGEGEGARGGGASMGEMMVYVNEMLEDDDEDVEFNTRKFVQTARSKMGEDLFDM